MTAVKTPMRVLVLTCLLLTGVMCDKDSEFVYGRLGGDALLPCTAQLSSDCSSVDWTVFQVGRVEYRQEVSRGQVMVNSDNYDRVSVTSNCSLNIPDLRVSDAGSYVCMTEKMPLTNVYLSILTITSPSTVSELQPGGILILSCNLSTYFDAGTCTSYTRTFNLRWLAEDGTELRNGTRYNLIKDTHCNITLITKLQKEDNNRKWRCQVDTAENSRVAFMDFKSSFLFQNSPTALNLNPVVPVECPVELPVSRVVLCVSLPVMVITVGLFTWKLDRKRAKTSAAAVELQEMN